MQNCIGIILCFSFSVKSLLQLSNATSANFLKLTQPLSPDSSASPLQERVTLSLQPSFRPSSINKMCCWFFVFGPKYITSTLSPAFESSTCILRSDLLRSRFWEIALLVKKIFKKFKWLKSVYFGPTKHELSHTISQKKYSKFCSIHNNWFFAHPIFLFASCVS